jgi:hypothetical protein
VNVIVAILSRKLEAIVELVVIDAFVMIPPSTVYSEAGMIYSLDESIIRNPFSRSESILTIISIRNVEVSAAMSGLMTFLNVTFTN